MNSEYQTIPTYYTGTTYVGENTAEGLEEKNIKISNFSLGIQRSLL